MFKKSVRAVSGLVSISGAAAAMVTISYSPTVSATYSQVSHWGTHVGQDDGDNSYVFCEPETLNFLFQGGARTHLQRVNATGEIADDDVVQSDLATMAKVECFGNEDLTGPSLVLTSAPSVDSNGDTAEIWCPIFAPYAKYAECNLMQIGGNTMFDPWAKPFTYYGTACGNGVTGISANLVAQHTGSPGYISSERMTNQVTDLQGNPPAWPWVNSTISGALVLGTDLGFPMFSDGKMHFVFGDTWLYDGMSVPSAAGRLPIINSTMVTTDYIAPMFNRYPFDEWYGAESDSVADQVITPDLEAWGAVPQGAFSFTEDGHNYKYITFISVKTFEASTCDPGRLRVNRGSIAYSKDDGPWERLDANHPTSGTWWGSDSYFSSMAAMQVIHGPDRGYVYLYGFVANKNMGPSNSAMRVARVPASHSAVTDKSAYEYWDGDSSAWVNQESEATDIVPASEHVRDITVAFNAYANRYLMMFLSAPETEVECGSDPQLKLFQSQTPQGPWTFVGDVPNTHPLNYSPQMHNRMTMRAGKDVTFFASEWAAYNVGSWQMMLERDTRTNCTQDIDI